ncbi:hypothetical protein Tcan_11664 [Toxocara canis]|uniref:Uncharacterized protein n=1 Tax=Toxocara canis TaxID=6265 RepID=A0A0B2VPB1_TOXCA|nr:hypothetical protein Tcan_11664 [Toxocara canis]
MSLLGQMKQGFAKALQIATDNTVYSELPECSMLSTVDKLSIKVANQFDVHKTTEKYIRNMDTNFAIKFLVRNEKTHKGAFVFAELISGRGFVVRNSAGGHIMDVKLPNNIGSALGKVVHPSQATLYKVLIANRTMYGSNYHVYKTGVEKPLIIVEKVALSLYPLAKMVGLLECQCVYWFRRPDRTILGYIRPKLVLNGRTVIVKFSATQTDAQLRAAMLGTALLIILHEVYPELKRVLEASIEESKLSPV